jgi:hypothetical protein
MIVAAMTSGADRSISRVSVNAIREPVESTVTSAIPLASFLVTWRRWKRSLISLVSLASLSIRPRHASMRSRASSGLKTRSSMVSLRSVGSPGQNI